MQVKQVRDLNNTLRSQEATVRLADLSDEDPETVARLILYMYFGRHALEPTRNIGWQASLAELLGLPKADMVKLTLPGLAALIAAAYKYQMSVSLTDLCTRAYEEIATIE